MLETFWLVLGYSCNNRCLGCYAESMEFDGLVSMPFSYAAEIVDAMEGMGVKKCLLIGGEPTLYPELSRLVAYMKNNTDIKTTLVTNGRMLASFDYAKRLADSGIDKVVISIEGSSANIHDKITQANSFEQTLKGIRNCLKLSVKTSTLTTISALNGDDLFAIAEMANDLGVVNIGYNCSIPSLGKNNRVNGDLTLPPAITARKIENTYALCKDKGIKVNFNMTIPLCLIDQKIIPSMMEDKSLAVGCQMYHGKGAAFDCHGSILPCTHFADAPLLNGAMNEERNFLLGETFQSIWENGAIANNFRDSLWKYPSEKCANCQYWGGCIGGCPLLWLKYDPQEHILNKERG